MGTRVCSSERDVARPPRLRRPRPPPCRRRRVGHPSLTPPRRRRSRPGRRRRKRPGRDLDGGDEPGRRTAGLRGRPRSTVRRLPRGARRVPHRDGRPRGRGSPGGDVGGIRGTVMNMERTSRASAPRRGLRRTFARISTSSPPSERTSRPTCFRSDPRSRSRLRRVPRVDRRDERRLLGYQLRPTRRRTRRPLARAGRRDERRLPVLHSRLAR